MWSLKREENKGKRDVLSSEYTGNLQMQRVGETSGVEASNLILEIAKFNVKVAEIDAQEKEELRIKFETILKSYNELKMDLIQKEKLIAKLFGPQDHRSPPLMISNRPAVASSSCPIVAFPPSPLLEINIDARISWEKQQLTKGTNKVREIRVQLEKEKDEHVKATSLVNQKYEERMTEAIMQFAHDLKPSILFNHVSRLQILFTALNKNKTEMVPILRKWIERSSSIKLFCWLSKAQTDPDPLIKPVHQSVKKIVEYDILLDNFMRKSNVLKRKLMFPSCELGPSVLTSQGELKELYKWREEMDALLSERVTGVLNDTYSFISTIKLLMTAKSKFDFIQQEVIQMESKWEQLANRETKFVSFDFPSEEVYNRWRYQYVPYAEKIDTPPTS